MDIIHVSTNNIQNVIRNIGNMDVEHHCPHQYQVNQKHWQHHGIKNTEWSEILNCQKKY
jgi:hypothetical protein